MSTSQRLDNSEQQKTRQQQSLGTVQVEGDSNNFNAIQADIVTLTQNKIIQISANEIKTRKFIEVSPYKGLKSFKLKDKDQFFGRDQFIAGLVDELEQTNFVLLLGASGSGKSSVVRAGLIPWLAEKWGSQWFNLTLTPDRDPFDSLYSSLRSHFKQSEVQFVRAGTDQSLGQLVKKLKQPDSFWFIFIDQLEELFTLSDSEKRDRFINSLATLCKEYEGDRTIKIVATMRADFLNRLDTNPANLLADATKGHRPLITQMHPDELRLAIEQPAAHHGVVFETGLVKTIIKDVQGQAGYLSLLQYTLDMLWKEEIQYAGLRDRTLSFKSYYRIGGVRGALQRRMDQIYESFSPQEQAAAQRIFLRLVGIGGDTTSETAWKPVRKREARSQFRNREEQAVLTQLIDANLLVSDTTVAQEEASATMLGQATGATIEITHEILLMSWEPLNKWIKENRKAIALRNRLNDDVIQWKITKSEDELWTGHKLEKVLALQKSTAFNQVLGGFSPDARAFIKASAGLRKGITQEQHPPKQTQRPAKKQPQQRTRQQQQTKLASSNQVDKTRKKNFPKEHLIAGGVMVLFATLIGTLIEPHVRTELAQASGSERTTQLSEPRRTIQSSEPRRTTQSSESGQKTQSSESKLTQETQSGQKTQSSESKLTQETQSGNTQPFNFGRTPYTPAPTPAPRATPKSPTPVPKPEPEPVLPTPVPEPAPKQLTPEPEPEPEPAPNPSPLTILHTRQGATSSHTDSYASYKTWGGSNWNASINSNGIFTHTAQGASSSHTDTIINYISWGGSEWTATIDPETKVFTHTRRGASSSHTDTILNYITWDGSAWTMQLD
ncbi:MAG: DUF4751 family protein [Cyanobacteria bacterium P01_F01_bin.53]